MPKNSCKHAVTVTRHRTVTDRHTRHGPRIGRAAPLQPPKLPPQTLVLSPRSGGSPGASAGSTAGRASTAALYPE